jgi:thiol-disulfide isomerase/thioredoxin
MPLGTEVVDYRVHRSLGYWNGTGLSDDPPPEAAQAIKPTRSTSLAKLMELAAKTPDSLFAAHAYFSQAILLKGGTYEAIDDRDSTGAERLLQRAIAACDHAGPPGLRLATTAKEELSQLRRWGLGKVAQQTEGEDMDGQKMKLSDHRGRVVVLTFWATWCPPCMAMITEERKLVERMAGKPFSLLGVNCNDGADLPKVKAVMATNKVTWPSFRDGGKSGPIASAWNVHNWPTIYVLDPNGVVRFRNVRGQALVEAVDALIHEAM